MSTLTVEEEYSEMFALSTDRRAKQINYIPVLMR
jgi:hypothetical protein